jgi:hypothetical protein
VSSFTEFNRLGTIKPAILIEVDGLLRLSQEVIPRCTDGPSLLGPLVSDLLWNRKRGRYRLISVAIA